MRHDILKAISEAADVTNAIILTHNIDFVFIHSLVLPALKKCGSPAITVFADANCGEQSYLLQHHVLSGLGTRYRVVSVPMSGSFKFHPKAILLSGPKRAHLFVGSGNLTFGGWRENAEVWTRYETDVDGTSPFAAFRDYLRQVVDLCTDPKESILREVSEAFDSGSRVWASEMSAPMHLLGRAGQGRSMLEQIKATVGDRRVDHLYICTPYFDEEAQALQTIADELCKGVCGTTVFVQSGRTTLLQTAAHELGSEITLKDVSFEHRERIGTNGEERTRKAFLHAKIYGVQSEGEVIVFAGSANCSQAALTIPGANGNAELLTWTRMSIADFEHAFLNELVIRNSAPTLGELSDLPPKTTPEHFIRIYSARQEAGRIEVACQHGPETFITQALVDNVAISPNNRSDGAFTFECGLVQPRNLVLLGMREGAEVRSASHWIDNEAALRVSARSRSLADSIDKLVRKGTWSVGAWTEVLGELCKHLEYMPERTFAAGLTGRSGAESHGRHEFSWSDVFATDYRFPIGAALPKFGPSGDERIGGLRSLLLRWFGIAQPSEGEDEIGDPPPEPNPDNGDGEGDRPSPLPTEVPLEGITNTERKRAMRLVGQISDRFADRNFISNRPPELLASDLKVAALLLRAGLFDNWLTEEDFLSSTLRIWLPLFFNAEGSDNTGWLEQRYLTAPSQEHFSASLGSVELAAALACWALSTPNNRATPEHARFVLASVLSVARLPWLWQSGGNNEIAKQVADVFAYTTRQSIDWKGIERRWVTMIRRGYALQRLNAAIAHESISELSKRIEQETVSAGELLWQGKYGFCVAGADCRRAANNNCDVLLLQRGETRTPFSGQFIIPVSGLLNERVLGESALPRQVRDEIMLMTHELTVGLRNLTLTSKK